MKGAAASGAPKRSTPRHSSSRTCATRRATEPPANPDLESRHADLLRRVALLVAAAAVLALPRRRVRGAPAGHRGAGLRLHARRTSIGSKAAGAGVVKISLAWKDVAPAAPPAAFNPADPNDPSYDWEPYDSQVRAAVATRAEPAAHRRAGARRGPSATSAARPGTRQPRPAAVRPVRRGGRAPLQRHRRRAAAGADVRGLERAQRELLPVPAAQRRRAATTRPGSTARW